jgi:hypothetical protein
MIRICQAGGPSHAVVIIIDGELVRDYVRLADEYCSRISAGANLRREVVLRHVSAVDTAGRELLSRLVRNGFRLRASGIYFSHLVKAIEQAALDAARSSEPSAEAH